MEIREYTDYKHDEILRLYSAVGWTAYTSDPEALKKGYGNSLLILAAYEGDELAGIIRAVGDGATVVFIQDLLILPEFQRRGIGTALVKALLQRFPSVRQIELAADNTPALAEFYGSLGFREYSKIGCAGYMKC